MKKYIKSYTEYTNINESYTNTSVKIGDILDESDIYSYVERIHRNDDDFIDGDIGDRIEKFKKYQVALIPIDKIQTDEYELDDDNVENYIKKYKQLGTYPPIVLGYYESQFGYNIIDGNHRANALKNAGVKEIICFVGLNGKQKKVI